MVYKYTKPRTAIAAMYSSPGPCYGLPGLVGQQYHDPCSSYCRGPAYIFGVRHTGLTCDSSPGPCYFPHSKIYRSGRDGSPHYSMYSRPSDHTTFQTPGPGTYSPEISARTARQSSAPAYSFGSRLAQNISTHSTPGPNSYSKPEMLGRTVESGKKQSPSYTLSGRSFHHDFNKTPGPGAYNVTDSNKYKRQSPQYSLSSRTVIPSDGTCKPGPAAHCPEHPARVDSTEKMKSILLMLIIMNALMPLSEAVTCYSCTTSISSSCGDPFESSSYTCRGDACVKGILKENGVTTLVVRHCVNYYDFTSLGCDCASSGGDSACMCYCDTYKCNVAVMTSSVGHVIIVISILINVIISHLL